MEKLSARSRLHYERIVALDLFKFMDGKLVFFFSSLLYFFLSFIRSFVLSLINSFIIFIYPLIVYLFCLFIYYNSTVHMANNYIFLGMFKRQLTLIETEKAKSR